MHYLSFYETNETQMCILIGWTDLEIGNIFNPF